MADYSDLSVLLVDPHPGMRANLRSMLTQSGISRIDEAVSAGTAIRQIGRKNYDIVLCEYDLGSGSGDGQDGQQLLEDLRHHKLIGPWTIFIMLTSEGVYSKVIGAAELTPTDYVLKPFTIEVLVQRLTRAVDRRAVLLPVYQLLAAGDTQPAIAACVAAEKTHPRQAHDFARLRAELLLEHGQPDQAELAYLTLLMTRPAGWAHLGLARCQFALRKYGEAQQTLDMLLQQHPRLMAAYDLLAQVHEALGQPDAAKKILEDAVAMSPHMVRRLRRLGAVAFQTGDVGTAEKAYKQVVLKARYSEFRDPEDHVNLVRALVRRGDANQASGVIRDMERSLRSNAKTEACRAFAAGLVMEMAGDKAGAVNQWTAAATAIGASQGLSTWLKIELVHSCISNQLDQHASQLMVGLMNDGDSGVSMDDAVGVFEKAGRHDLARDLGAEIERRVEELVDDATRLGGAGDLRAATDTLNAALRKAPAHVALLPAAASAMLQQLDGLGWEGPLGEQCARVLERLRRIDPRHPSLEALNARYLSTRRKYGIAIVA